MRRLVTTLTAAGALLAHAVPARAADPPGVAEALKTIRAVGKEGTGNADAAKAWKAVVAGKGAALLPTLAAFDGASPTVANWLRSAVDAIAEQEEHEGKALSKIDLAKFAADRKQSAAARRIAFELVRKADKTAAATLLDGFLDDPSAELRHDAIAARLATAKTIGDDKAAAVEYAALFKAARAADQVDEIAKKLAELKVPVDVTRHYGYVTEWHVSGTFDNKDGTGFAKAYEPEKAGTAKEWKYVQGSSKDGTIDVNATVGKNKDAAAYAAATLVAEKETACEVRLATQNAVKVFVNGVEVFAREEYHHGTSMDQHIAKVTLKPGKNELLVKVCQNDLPYEWAQVWGFAARVCDATGGAIPLKQAITKDGKETIVDTGALAPAPPTPAKEAQ